MKEPVKVYRSRNGVHKFMAVFPEGKTVRFGRKGYSDYTMHKDAERMKRYLTRHRSRESWGRSGRYTAGFWSRWFLWSKPSLEGARKETQRVLGQKVKII
jgi:hypothetical protein